MPVSSIYTDPNSLDLTTGQVLTQTVWEQVLGDLLFMFGTTGTYSVWSPTVNQPSALTITSVGRFMQFGKLVLATVDVSITSAGITANGINIGGLPVASQQIGAGVGVYIRTASAGSYAISSRWANATTVNLYTSGGTSSLGVNPAFAAANGDAMSFTILYIA